MIEKNKKPVCITSWDDGKKSDLWLVEKLLKYKLPAIFYIPSNCELSKREIKNIAEHFEIGGHTETHQWLTRLTPKEAWFEIKDNKIWLENLLSREITSFAPPRGYYNKQIIKLIKKAGFKESRTVKVFNIFTPKNLFEIETTMHITCPIRSEYNNQELEQLSINWIDKAFEEGDYLSFWGHSEEMFRYSIEDKVERILQYLSNKMMGVDK